MIRDPSDGTVREPKPITGLSSAIETETSGLPTEKIDAKRLKQLEDSRDWLKAYFHRKTEGE